MWATGFCSDASVSSSFHYFFCRFRGESRLLTKGLGCSKSMHLSRTKGRPNPIQLGRPFSWARCGALRCRLLQARTQYSPLLVGRRDYLGRGVARSPTGHRLLPPPLAGPPAAPFAVPSPRQPSLLQLRLHQRRKKEAHECTVRHSFHACTRQEPGGNRLGQHDRRKTKLTTHSLDVVVVSHCSRETLPYARDTRNTKHANVHASF